MSALPQSPGEAVAAPLDERELAQAFAWFAAAAHSLERSYTHLHGEVARLRGELEEANHDLAVAREALGRRQALDEMSALLAHEVRNPLCSLELFAGLLAESKLEGEMGEWIFQMQAGLRSLTATVNNILHFHGQPPPQLAATDLGPLLRSLADFLRPLAKQSGVQLEVSHRLDGVWAAADADQLKQVVLNLGMNAFRSMPQGGALTIHGGQAAASGGGMVAIIEVADSGPGISAEHLEEIFRPGFSTRAGGPGLGLAVCKTILEQHGGRIAAAGTPGAGTTFRLQLPLLEGTR